LILGHQAAGTFGIAPRPAGNLTEQFLHAEATTLQLGAGMALAHRFPPAVNGLERGLDLSVRSSNRSIVRSFDEPDPRAHELTNAPSNPFFQPAFALETLGLTRSLRPQDENPRHPPIFFMEGGEEGEGSGRPPPPDREA